jgi:hypothetical protein
MLAWQALPWKLAKGVAVAMGGFITVAAALVGLLKVLGWI